MTAEEIAIGLETGKFALSEGNAAGLELLEEILANIETLNYAVVELTQRVDRMEQRK